MAGIEFGHPAAFNTQGQAHVYDPEPGRAEFREPEYHQYEWELPNPPTTPSGALLPHELAPEPQEVPDYHSTLTSVQLMRDALSRAEVEGPLDPVFSEFLRYSRTTAETDATRRPDEAIHEIEAAIDRARLRNEPLFPPSRMGRLL